MTTYAIYYEKAEGAENVVMLHVPVHYPGVYKQKDEHDYKKRLAVLKRAKHRINTEIQAAENKIKYDAIQASGQIDLEESIKEITKSTK